ncbi:mannonate dehydratase [Gorillibacterium sp. sgz5001074]|uniref:mannonate dehydratase n=1 Tax=Gorillibacterium sp. sgz5001074 TaxID=3446695 RepID=UPI003F680E3D
MKLSFRWYGQDDPVTLDKIRQIPNLYSIVTAVYDVPVGEVWSRESIAATKKQVEDHGIVFDVIESVPVHEDIKLGKPAREVYIANYQENIRRLAEAGVKVICYNFMPVFDWTRTQLDKLLPDGSTALVYYKDQLEKMDPLTGELSLPGWDSSYKKEDLKKLFDEYAQLTQEDLWSNLQYFLEKIIPVAEECDVKMAIHPDDPPWNIFGLPRIITGEAALDRFLKLVDSKYNGLTFCTGSLGCTKDNDIYGMLEKYSRMGRIHFMHVRNVKILEDGSFEESAHFSPCGSLDIVKVLKPLAENGFDGYLRPDHGRMIWGETGRAGYGLFDRALGASYLTGIWETLVKTGAREAVESK